MHRAPEIGNENTSSCEQRTFHVGRRRIHARGTRIERDNSRRAALDRAERSRFSILGRGCVLPYGWVIGAPRHPCAAPAGWAREAQAQRRVSAPVTVLASSPYPEGTMEETVHWL